jgi:hypothetical protein
MSEIRWRKSTRSNDQSLCVELAGTGLVRDSKNPDGPVLRANLPGLLAAIRAGHLAH